MARNFAVSNKLGGLGTVALIVLMGAVLVAIFF
jgi:hypothetical protein